MIARCGWLLPFLIGAAGLTAGQDTPAQEPTQTTTQNLSQQSSGADSSGTVRTAPAAALTGLVGLEDAGMEDTSHNLPQIPALLGGAGPSMAFVSEMERSNYLRGGVNVGATYDDNPLLVPNGAVSNTSESVFPNISVEQTTSRTRWNLAYAGGLTVNQKLTSQNQGSHNLNFDSQFRLSPHVNLRVAERFLITTGFFDAASGPDEVTGSGGPNASLLAPLSTLRSTITTVEANYHLALNDLIGASGSYYDLNYTNVPAGTELADTQTASGAAFWMHKIFRQDWGGLAYRFQRISYDPAGHGLVHSFLVVDTAQLTNRITFSLFAGPQYTDSQGVAPGAAGSTQSNFWTATGGAEVAWQDQRTSLSGGYLRSITDGAGLLGVVRLENVHANFRRALFSGWAASLSATHGSNTSITVLPGTFASSINLTSAGAGLERNVGKSLGLRLAYTHDFQQEFGVSGTQQTLDAHRNRFVATLSYQWAKPIGR